MRLFHTILLSAALLAGGSIFAAAQYTGGVYQNGVYVGQNNQNSEAYQRGWRDAQDDASHGRQSSTRVSRYHNDADRQAYDQGYAQGYQAWTNGQNGVYNGRRRGDCDRDNPNCYSNNGQVYAPNGTWQNGTWQNGRRRSHCDDDDAYCNGYPNPNYRGDQGSYSSGTYNGGYYGNGYGYNNNGAQVAQQYGYNDGLREGANDRANGHSYRPTNDTGYRLATNGYQGQFGSKDQYRSWYRQSYEQGYQQGYNGGGNYGNGYPPRH